jgi:hypothetical protein
MLAKLNIIETNNGEGATSTLICEFHIHLEEINMSLSQKLRHLNFPHDTIQAELKECAGTVAEAKKTTLASDQHGNITAACFTMLGSHFPIETLTPGDFASFDTIWFNSCADCILPLLNGHAFRFLIQNGSV